MPSCKRRLAQIERENEKCAKTSVSMFKFLKRSTETNSSACKPQSECVQERNTSAYEEAAADAEVQIYSSSEKKRSGPVPSCEPPAKQLQKSSHKVGFDNKWQSGRPWLITRTEMDEDNIQRQVMYCTLCQKHKSWGFNGSKTWVEKGCRTLRLDKVKEHENSLQHKESLATSLTQTLEAVNEKTTTAAQQAIADALRVLFFIIKKNLPLALFSDMCDLCIEVGADSLQNLRLTRNATYNSWDIVYELLQLLSDDVRSEVTEQIRNSECFAVMTDEVTDVTTTKHVALSCRYVDKNGNIKTSFLSDSDIPVATADHLVMKICSEVESADLEVSKMSGFASDGAAVFTGKKNGVAKQLKDLNPEMLTIHCKDHCLALACRDSFGDEPAFKKLDETLDSLYGYYHYSSNKKASLKAVQEAFGDVPLVIKQAKHHRWLSHQKSVDSIVRSYKSIVVDLESSTISKDPQGHGLLKTLKCPDTLRYLLLLADVLPHVTSLSLFFQQRECHIGEVSNRVGRTIKNLQVLQKSDGSWLRKASAIMEDCQIPPELPSEKFTTAREKFLQKLATNIKDRFSNTDVLDNLAILDLSQHDSIPALYGSFEMEQLACHYRMDPDNLLYQWQDFLQVISGRQPSLRTLPELVKLFYSPDNKQKALTSQYPLVSHIVAAAGVMPLSTAEVERVFSQLKLVKTNHRASLKTKTIDMLLNVKLNCTDEMFQVMQTNTVKKFFKKERKLSTVCKTHL